MAFNSATSPVQYKTIATANLEMVQGDDELYRAFLEQWNPTTEVWEPFDLTGVVDIDFTIKNKSTKVELYNGKKTTGEITVVGAEADGQITIEPASADTRNVPEGIHFYDIQVTTSTSKKKTALTGDILVVIDATT